MFGNLLIDLERDVEGEAAILIALGLPASLPPGGTELQRDREVRKRVFDPKSVINGSIIQSKAGSPYAIEILVNGTAKSAKDDEGLAFVKIKRGETYAVRLINKSPHEAAVKLRIDGLSMFAFSEVGDKGSPRYSAVIVPAKSSVTIKGWHVTNKATDKFLVTSYAKSAAKILKSTAKVGTITASFQAAWKLNDQPAGKRKGGDGDATGRGPRIDVKFKEVQRNLGKIRDNIVVRYTKPQ